LILRGMRAALSLFAMLRLHRRSAALDMVGGSPNGAIVPDVSARLRC
jgi:hypothetical protein